VSLDDKNAARYWAVIPAAGAGRRMQGHLPKQYLPLAGKTVIEHTLVHFINHPHISGIVIALSPGDTHWPTLSVVSDKPLVLTEGGSERCHSVLNALLALSGTASDHDWALVHDAARPCLSRDDIDSLLQIASQHVTGGLLGIPVRDTIKRTTDDNEVESTVDRNGLWHAMTPQMFRIGELREAIQSALAAQQIVTDEASAMELSGKRPVMVEGNAGNLKITRPEDLILAEFYIRRGMFDTQQQPTLEDIDGLNTDEG
jgi:2-C-methyl-D-erythritol 4-phosphate cytidylyltransferase